MIDLPPPEIGVTPRLAEYPGDWSELIDGNEYYQECWYIESGEIFHAETFTYVPGERGPNVYALARSAASRVQLDLPEPQMAPRVDGTHLVGLATWLWVEPSHWNPVTAHAEVPGVAVTVTAEPTALTWEMGDGETVTCSGPGLPWDFDGANPEASDCAHTFQHISAREPDGRYHGSVTMTWDVSWQATTGESGELGTQRRSAPFGLTVTERQAVTCAGRIDDCLR